MKKDRSAHISNTSVSISVETTIDGWEEEASREVSCKDCPESRLRAIKDGVLKLFAIDVPEGVIVERIYVGFSNNYAWIYASVELVNAHGAVKKIQHSKFPSKEEQEEAERIWELIDSLR